MLADVCARDCSGNPFYEVRVKRLKRKARPLGSAQSLIMHRDFYP